MVAASGIIKDSFFCPGVVTKICILFTSCRGKLTAYAQLYLVIKCEINTFDTCFQSIALRNMDPITLSRWPLDAQYRYHARKYARETAVMSFTVTKNPSYQALLAMGRDIVPFLLQDIAKQETPRPDWDYSFWGSVHLLCELTQEHPWEPD